MNKVVTKAVVLNRLNYGEADRILTIITPDHGKVRAIAKGVRKEKSKLAGGIELFSISNVSYIPGKREIGTLISTRLQTNYGNIVKDLPRTQLGYQVLKTLDKVTEDECGPEFFDLLAETMQALNDRIDLNLIECWFNMRLLNLLGHEPNLATDTKGNKLEQGKAYRFDYDNMAFFAHTNGEYRDKHIKLLRLLPLKPVKSISTIEGINEIVPKCAKLTRQLIQLFTQ